MLKTAAIWIWRNATSSPKHFAKETFGFDFETFGFIQEQPRLRGKVAHVTTQALLKKNLQWPETQKNLE